MDLLINTVGATSVIVNFANVPADHSVQLQYSTRKDFQLCVCPVITYTAAQPANATLADMNQDTVYFLRAREYSLVDGTEGAWTPILPLRTDLTTAPNTAVDAVTHERAMVVLPAPIIAWHAGNEVDGHPVENLELDAAVAWRSIDAGGNHSFSVEMGPETIDTIALLMSNIPESAQITVAAGNSLANAQGGTPTYSHGPVPFRASENLGGRPGYHGLIELPSPEEHRFWHIKITADCPGDLLHLEHAVFGLNRATKKHAVDKTENITDLGSVSRSRSGMPLRALGARLRKVDFDLAAMTEEQYEVLYSEIGPRVGLTEPVLIVPNPKANAFRHDRILYGTLLSSQTTNNRAHLFSRRFSIESLV